MASVKRKATVAAVGALVASALLGLCVAHGVSSAVIADFQKSMSPEFRAHVQAEEVKDTPRYGLPIASVLVPLTVAVVWWWSRRKGGPT